MKWVLALFPNDKYTEIKTVARAEGNTVSEWVTTAALQRLDPPDPPEPDLEYDGGQP